MQRRRFLNSLLAAALGFATGVLTTAALAKPGRPASPNSVAGVSRRTRRRRRRRVHRNMRLTSLPYGCNVTRVQRENGHSRLPGNSVRTLRRPRATTIAVASGTNRHIKAQRLSTWCTKSNPARIPMLNLKSTTRRFEIRSTSSQSRDVAGR